jgi:uncharacterized protein (TIGR00255 family)
MTGFGRGVAKSHLGTITTEIKTLNHRYLDMVIKMPKELQVLEPRIKGLTKELIHRGRVEITVERMGGEDNTLAEINYSLARSYLTNLQKLGKKLKLKDSLSLSQMCRMPGVIEIRTLPVSIEKMWVEIKKSMNKALKSLLIMRKREGKSIEKDIRKRIAIIEKKQKEIEKTLPLLLNNYRKDLGARLSELSGRTKNEKLSSEIALLSEKVDVSEELSRFSSHLNQLGIFLNEKEDVGKKINFTIQEMMREINTMSAKANNFSISRASIIIRSELEKIREQVQNVE